MVSGTNKNSVTLWNILKILNFNLFGELVLTSTTVESMLRYNNPEIGFHHRPARHLSKSRNFVFKPFSFKLQRMSLKLKTTLSTIGLIELEVYDWTWQTQCAIVHLLYCLWQLICEDIEEWNIPRPSWLKCALRGDQLCTGPKRTAILGTWWYWVNNRRYQLILDGTG